MMLPFKHPCIYVLFLFLLIAGNSLKVSAQVSNPEVDITDGKLKWKYYTAPIDTNSKYSCLTQWLVYYNYTLKVLHGDTIAVDLKMRTCLKNTSWVLPSQKAKRLLHHEQGHFNFALITANEFKKVIDTTTLLNYNYKQKIDSVFKAVLTKYSNMENSYDIETNHMMNKKGQRLWNKKIKTMLKQINS